MSPIRIVKGLDAPIAGASEQMISDGAPVSAVAVFGSDYSGPHPSGLVGTHIHRLNPVSAEKERVPAPCIRLDAGDTPRVT